MRSCFLHNGGIVGIEARADIGGEHTGVIEGSSYFDIAVIAAGIDDFGNGVLEVEGGHSGSADASDFLFINKQADSGTFYASKLEHCLVGRVSAKRGRRGRSP